MTLPPKLWPSLVLALSIGFAAATAVLAANNGTTAKPPSGGCTAAASRIAYSVNVSNSNDLYAVNPDGTCRVKLTAGNFVRAVLAWTADKHILVSNSGSTSQRLLSVPNSANASSVTTVATWSTPKVEDISQHRDATSILPASQQLLAAAESNNIVVYTADRTVRTELTSYVSTYTPGGTGSEYHIERPRWLPDSADRSRIRLVYNYLRIDYVDGIIVDDDQGLRVLSMGTATWPAISTGSLLDDWVGGRNDILAGYPLNVYTLVNFSRDGTKAGTRGPFGDGIYVLPVIIDDTADTVTIDTPNAVHIATNVGSQSIQHHVSFSPDNSKLVYQALTTVGSGGNATSVQSLFVIGSGSPSGAVQVDGFSKEQACCMIWGPNGG